MTCPVTLTDAALVERGVDPVNKLEPSKRWRRRTALERYFCTAVLGGASTPAQERWLLDNPGWLPRRDDGPTIHRLIQERPMGRRPIPETEKDVTRRKIVKAARETVGSGEKPTARRVAAATGVAAMTLYTYFKNTEQIVAAVRAKIVDDLIDGTCPAGDREWFFATCPVGDAQAQRLIAAGKAQA